MVGAKMDQLEGLCCCDWFYCPLILTTNHRALLQSPPGPAYAAGARQMNCNIEQVWLETLQNGHLEFLWIDDNATKELGIL